MQHKIAKEANFCMPAQWTADIIGEMHLNGVRKQELAKELGVTAEYVSMLLNGHRSPPNAETRCREALARLIARQQKDSA